MSLSDARLMGALMFLPAGLGVQSLEGLARDCGDYLEIFVNVQDREARQFGG